MKTTGRMAIGGFPAGALFASCLALALGVVGVRPALARGGGGCFLAGTPILRADGSAVDIAAVRAGDEVLAFGEDGATVATVVREVLELGAESHRVLTVGDASLAVTDEHPFLASEGAFRLARELRPGDRVFAFDGVGGLIPRVVTAVREVLGPVTVYNLRTNAPHTFFAAGIAVHNKGGGGGGGGGHSGGGGGFHGGGGSGLHPGIGGGTGAADDDVLPFAFGGGVVVVLILMALRSARRRGVGNLDFVYPPGQVAPKADMTRKLLEFIAKQDDAMAPDRLAETARSTFLKLQECWLAREYAPMKPLVMPDLYLLHGKQLEGMKLQHEINVLEGLAVDRVDIVNVRYTYRPDQREFTALITATARDTYIDDRTQAFVRGDPAPAQFQEFWTFQMQPTPEHAKGAWILRTIEQTRESRALKDENFFEQFTDAQLQQVYGAPVDRTGAAGPWLEKGVLTKAVKIERMLNFLAMTDRLWQQQPMLERARQVFLRVYLAQEAGEITDDTAGLMFPDVAANLREKVAGWKQQGLSTEYRNLCVRKVEILLVRNHADNAQDEFFVRIGAHAQRVVRRDDAVVSQDADVTFFEAYWTFGRLGGAWALKGVLPPASGDKLLAEENLDEESSPQQVQWYYTKKRAL